MLIVLFNSSFSHSKVVSQKKDRRWDDRIVAKYKDSSSHQSAHTHSTWTPKLLNPNLLSINFTQESFKPNHFVDTLFNSILFSSAEMSVYSYFHSEMHRLFELL